MDRIQAMRLFMRIVERGSCTQAARDLQIPRVPLIAVFGRRVFLPALVARDRSMASRIWPAAISSVAALACHRPSH
jgi:hypothetical protein